MEFLFNGDEVEVDAKNNDIVSYYGHNCDQFGSSRYEVQAQNQFITDGVEDHTEGDSRLAPRS